MNDYPNPRPVYGNPSFTTLPLRNNRDSSSSDFPPQYGEQTVAGALRHLAGVFWLPVAVASGVAGIIYLLYLIFRWYERRFWMKAEKGAVAALKKVWNTKFSSTTKTAVDYVVKAFGVYIVYRIAKLIVTKVKEYRKNRLNADNSIEEAFRGTQSIWFQKSLSLVMLVGGVLTLSGENVMSVVKDYSFVLSHFCNFLLSGDSREDSISEELANTIKTSYDAYLSANWLLRSTKKRRLMFLICEARDALRREASKDERKHLEKNEKKIFDSLADVNIKSAFLKPDSRTIKNNLVDFGEDDPEGAASYGTLMPKLKKMFKGNMSSGIIFSIRDVINTHFPSIVLSTVFAIVLASLYYAYTTYKAKYSDETFDLDDDVYFKKSKRNHRDLRNQQDFMGMMYSDDDYSDNGRDDYAGYIREESTSRRFSPEYLVVKAKKHGMTLEALDDTLRMEVNPEAYIANSHRVPKEIPPVMLFKSGSKTSSCFPTVLDGANVFLGAKHGLDGTGPIEVVDEKSGAKWSCDPVSSSRKDGVALVPRQNYNGRVWSLANDKTIVKPNSPVTMITPDFVQAGRVSKIEPSVSGVSLYSDYTSEKRDSGSPVSLSSNDSSFRVAAIHTGNTSDGNVSLLIGDVVPELVAGIRMLREEKKKIAQAKSQPKNDKSGGKVSQLESSIHSSSSQEDTE